MPLLFSRDVYSYAFYGRIAAVYHANPYVQTPVEFGGDALWPLVGPKWVDTPAVYGPLFTTISGGIARLFEAPAGQVDAYRWLAALPRASRRWRSWRSPHGRVRPGREAFAVAAFGLNPVVLFHTVASGHNDLIVALAVAGGFALMVRGRELLGRRSAGPRRRREGHGRAPARPGDRVVRGATATGTARPRDLTHAGLALAIGLLFALPYLQAEDPALGMLQLAGHEGWLAPSVHAEGLRLPELRHDGLARPGGVRGDLIVAFVQLARDVGRRAAGDETIKAVGAAMGWSLVLLLLLGPVLLPWYVAWALPLIWLLPKAPRGTLGRAGAALASPQWSTEPLRYPDAFAVNLWIGHWIVTPAMLALVVWCLARPSATRCETFFRWTRPIAFPRARGQG